MERTPCKKCFGKGKATVKNESGFDISITCPMCGGSGYENIYGTQDYESEDEEHIIKNDSDENIIISDKDKILNQIIKYPKLFTEGITFLYECENSEVFIYFKNKYMFNISNKDNGFYISLKNEYKNKLAEMIILKLTGKENEI